MIFLIFLGVLLYGKYLTINHEAAACLAMMGFIEFLFELVTVLHHLW